MHIINTKLRWIFLLVFISLTTISIAESSKVDSLLKLIPSASDTTKVKLLLEVSFEYSTKDLNKSLDYSRKALLLANDLKKEEWICTALNGIALAKSQSGEVDSSIFYYKQILNRTTAQLNNKKKVALNGLGMAYYEKGEYETSLKYYMQVLEYAEKDNDSLNISRAYNNIANIFYAQEQYIKALEYHFKSLAIGEQLKNKTMIAGSYHNIAICYGKLGQNDKALENYFKTLKITEEIGHKLGMSYTLNNIGAIYVEQKKWKEAIHALNKALDLKYELGDQKGISKSYSNLGSAYIELKNYPQAIEFLKKSIAISKEIDSKENLMTAYNSISGAYYETGDYKNAFESFKEYATVKDSLYTQESQENINKINAKYESDKKDKENALLAQQNKIVHLQANKQKNLIAFLAIIVLLLGGMGFVIFKRFQEKKKMAETLQKLSIVASKTDNYVSITDKEDIISWTNDGFTRITGYDSVEVMNKSLPTLLRGSGTDVETINRISEKKKSGTPFTEEILNYKKDGSPVWLSFNVTPVKNEIGVVEKYIAIGSDITEKKIAEHQLKLFTLTLEEKNKSINESLRYASKIQAAILPPNKLMDEILKDYLIFYKPKDIVSGDFYWIEKKDDIIYFAVVDCTGHGVPGALMSMIGFNSLNKIVRENLIYSPAHILDKLNEEIESILRQKEVHDIKDGMDIALCMFDTKTKELEYAGANNPLYIIRRTNEALTESYSLEATEWEGKLLYEIKADRQPIGLFENRKQFTNHKFKLLSGDSLYISSDGYADQFGGPKIKKFQYRKFKELLLKINDKSMPEQKILVESTFYDWKADHEQIDDICILGLRI